MHPVKWLLCLALTATSVSTAFSQCQQSQRMRRSQGGSVGRIMTFANSSNNSFPGAFGRLGGRSFGRQLNTGLRQRQRLIQQVQQQQLLTLLRQQQQMLTFLQQQQQLNTLRNQTARMTDLVLRTAILRNVQRLELARTSQRTPNRQSVFQTVGSRQQTLIEEARRRWGISWRNQLVANPALGSTSGSSQSTQSQQVTTPPESTGTVSLRAPAGLLPPSEEQVTTSLESAGTTSQNAPVLLQPAAEPTTETPERGIRLPSGQ
ncbi:MAG: hypothetical protein ACFCD0_05820 [Gemmataceae bacterium]